MTLAAGIATFACIAAVGAGAAPVTFTLIFHGSREPMPDVGSPFGLGNVGPFSASAPFCSSGRATDIKHEWTRTVARAFRRFTCDDGSGSMTAVVEDVREELGADGDWKIVAGTGDYARLRGKGVFESVVTGGDSPETFTFTSRWRGVVDFDDVSPGVRISRLTATRLRRPNGAYLVRLAFSAPDDLDSNAVSYTAKVRSGSIEALSRKGMTTSGTVSLSVRIRPPRSAKRVAVTITASDPVGNERTITHSRRLRR